MQDLLPDFMKFVTRPTHGVVLRILAFCLIVVGIVAAILDAKWAGFTPLVWFLLALIAILGVICNALAQMLVRRGTHRHAHPTGLDEAPAGAPTPAVDAAAEPGQPTAEPEKPAEPSWLEVEIYCVKCRDRRIIRDPETVTLANGRPAYQGTCPVCGTKVSRIRKAE